MSLLTSASPWTDSTTISRKRLPSIRKTKKNMPNTVDASEDSLEETEEKPNSLDELQKGQQGRQSKVDQLINNMAELNESDDGSGLSDFQPLEHPLLQEIGKSQEGKQADEEIGSLPNPMQQPPPRMQHTVGDFTSINSDTIEQRKPNPYSNYRRVYEAPKIAPPNDYYAKMGLGVQPTIDNKLMEKINYMIHMLEQQQNEKTSNLTEEFILYMFLGIFIIFIVDSFSRSSLKYVR